MRPAPRNILLPRNDLFARVARYGDARFDKSEEAGAKARKEAFLRPHVPVPALGCTRVGLAVKSLGKLQIV